jgi:hypothetical protein
MKSPGLLFQRPVTHTLAKKKYTLPYDGGSVPGFNSFVLILRSGAMLPCD